MTDAKQYNNVLNRSREMFDTLQPPTIRSSLMKMPEPIGKDFAKTGTIRRGSGAPFASTANGGFKLHGNNNFISQKGKEPIKIAVKLPITII